MDVPTLGVEEEFLLAAPEDGRPLPVADEVLGKVGRLADGAAVHRELRATQVEHATGVCTTAAQLRDQLRRVAGAVPRGGRRRLRASGHRQPGRHPPFPRRAAAT